MVELALTGLLVRGMTANGAKRKLILDVPSFRFCPFSDLPTYMGQTSNG
jgi:hypothetical protein